LRHIDGLEQLFAMQRPLSIESDPVDRALLEVTRPMMIVAALIARRPSLMASSGWNAVSLSMLDNDPLAYIWDALAQIPELYYEQDALVPWRPTHEQSSLTAIRSLLSRSLRFRDDMIFQRYQWKNSNPDSDFPGSPRMVVPSSQEYLCTVVTHFPSLEAANAFTLYNALVIMINQFIISTNLLLPACNVDVTLQKSASEQIAAATMNIVKSIDYHLLITKVSVVGTPSQSNFCLLLPMRIAHRVLSQSKSPSNKSKKLWIKDVLDFIKTKAGSWMSQRSNIWH
jgi:hypothetical protein